MALQTVAGAVETDMLAAVVLHNIVLLVCASGLECIVLFLF